MARPEWSDTTTGLDGSTRMGSTIGLEDSIGTRNVPTRTEQPNPRYEAVDMQSAAFSLQLIRCFCSTCGSDIQPRTRRTDTYKTSIATSVASAAAREPIR